MVLNVLYIYVDAYLYFLLVYEIDAPVYNVHTHLCSKASEQFTEAAFFRHCSCVSCYTKGLLCCLSRYERFSDSNYASDVLKHSMRPSNWMVYGIYNILAHIRLNLIHQRHIHLTKRTVNT